MLKNRKFEIQISGKRVLDREEYERAYDQVCCWPSIGPSSF